MLTDQEKTHIEEIRRRAKDSKAANAHFFLQHSLESLDKLRNILFLSSFALIGYLGAINKPLSKPSFYYFGASIILGFISYIFLYIFDNTKTKLYSDLEKNMSISSVLNANPYDEYFEMIRKEKPIYNQYKNTNTWHILQIVSVIAQGIFLVLFAKTVLR